MSVKPPHGRMFSATWEGGEPTIRHFCFDQTLEQRRSASLILCASIRDLDAHARRMCFPLVQRLVSCVSVNATGALMGA